jgi:hypothetical protein
MRASWRTTIYIREYRVTSTSVNKKTPSCDVVRDVDEEARDDGVEASPAA